MRPRIRTIKPEIGSHEDLWELGEETGLPVFQAFVLLWCHADREGRFEWRPKRLKTDILPYWDGDFSRVLDALCTRGLLVKYASQGRHYGLIPTFLRHQIVNNREAPSELPSLEESTAIQPDSRAPDASSSRAGRVPHAEFRSPSVPNPIPVVTLSHEVATASVASHLPDPASPPAEPPVRLANRPISETLVSATLDELRPGPGSLPPSSPQDSVSSQVRPVAPPVGSNPVSEAPKRNAPRSLADALVIPLAERSKWAEANVHAVEWVVPQQWPELVSVATALHSAAGLAPPRLGAYARDSGVRALVGLFAAGYGVDELLAVIPQLVESDWWRANRRGLSALTPEVIRRASAPPPPKQHLTQADAILQRQLDRVAMLEAKEAAEKRMLT